jgi:hypothetical protein
VTATDYNPVYLPGDAITLTASGLIGAGDLLVVSGSGTVAAASADASRAVIGVAGGAALAAERVLVYGRGPVHESVADGTVTAGDQVRSTGTAGRTVAPLPPAATLLPGTYSAADAQAAVDAAVNAARAAIGIAITTAADGVKVRWMFF